MSVDKKSLTYPDTPNSIASITLGYMVDYCKDKKQVKWLKDTKNSIEAPADANLRKAYFIPIRRLFVEKFFPELLKPKTTHYKNILNVIDDL